MKKRILMLCFFGIPSLLLACTTLCFKDKNGKIVFARNFDFPVGTGHIEVNQKNLLKKAFIAPPEKPLEWISKYGSVSFNQAGREFPYGGMNEAGLVIEQMWVQEAVYPEADERYGLTELQWIQYQLDCSATVQEVIDSKSFLRISFQSIAPLHFLVADRSGDVATLEYIDGTLVVHHGASLPYPVLANCTYEHSLKYKQGIETEAKIEFTAYTQNSSGRFVKAANMVEAYDGNQPIVDYAFRILDSVAQGNSTQWSIVYDLTGQQIHYKSSGYSMTQTVHLENLDFFCGNPPLFFPVSAKKSNDQQFQVCTFRENLSLIEQVFSNLDHFKEHLSQEMMEASAHYMESVQCTSK
jgi:choloylglycine hydrolase